MKRNRKQFEDSERLLNDSTVGGTSCNSSILNTSKSDSIAGKIEALQMTNFMCHSNLELKFNQKVNFITGKNGSGKSAIMTALIVALGGKASLTGRGSDLSDFIKKGESWAKVSVTLINEGTNSYKRDVYGNRIHISRNLSKSAANMYVCKSESGVIISKKKGEVDNIIIALNLQIKNPICVLNQDVARSFLCATDDSVRFTMFMKATQLESLKLIYVKTLELLVEAKKQLETKQKAIKDASLEMARLKEKLEFLASLEKYVHEKTALENEFVWSMVVAEEKKLEELLNREKSVIEKRSESLQKKEKVSEVISNLELEIKKFQDQINQVKSSNEEKLKEKCEVRKEVQIVEREVEKTDCQLKLLISKQQRELVEITKVKEYLEKKEAIESQSQAEIEESKKKIDAKKAQLSELRDKIADAQRTLTWLQESKIQHSKNEENTRVDLGELEQNKKRVEILLAEAKNKGQNNLFKYGHFTQELLGAISDAAKRGHFVHKPVGPCGVHVRLSGDPKWARAVESAIGGLMTTYCCDNQKDFQVLSRIMERICGNKQPSIIISKFLKSRHNVESEKVSVRGLPSVLDVLQFDNDIVFNTFIDQARIETILLFETDAQAASILTHVQNVPKNLRMGLTVQSDQYFPAPNYRTYYGDSTRPLKFFETASKTSGDRIHKLETELRETNRGILEKSTEIMNIRQLYQKTCKEVSESESSYRQWKQMEKKVQVELNQLKDIEDSRPVIKTKVVLEEELQSLENKYQELLEKSNQCKETLELLNEKKIVCAKRLNAIAALENDMERKLSEIHEKIEEKRFELRQVSKRKHGTNSQLEEFNKILKEIENAIADSRNEVAEKIQSAKNACSERVDTLRSPVEVQKSLEKCERYLKAAEREIGTREATITEYKRKNQLYEKMKKTAATLKGAIKTLTQAAFAKEQKLHILQSHTANLVSFYFQATLQIRGYDGHLKVDFKNETLTIEVKPKDATIARKDSKTLSGGERSYSTVSFILAIWKVVDMPIYFLDEFDVFMDKVNRKVIMDLLLEHASFQSNKQFVFITPQDTSSVQNSKVVSVYRLPDPERNIR